MKTKQIWANLTVKDIKRTAEFYTSLGIKPNMPNNSQELTSFLFGDDDFVIHFFIEEKMQASMNSKVADLKNGSEVMFSLSAESKEEVDDWAKKAKEAGGTIFREACKDKDGYYYCGFADPDGHKFNVLLVEKGMCFLFPRVFTKCTILKKTSNCETPMHAERNGPDKNSYYLQPFIRKE